MLGLKAEQIMLVWELYVLGVMEGGWAKSTNTRLGLPTVKQGIIWGGGRTGPLSTSAGPGKINLSRVQARDKRPLTGWLSWRPWWWDKRRVWRVRRRAFRVPLRARSYLSPRRRTQTMTGLGWRIKVECARGAHWLGRRCASRNRSPRRNWCNTIIRIWRCNHPWRARHIDGDVMLAHRARAGAVREECLWQEVWAGERSMPFRCSGGRVL